MKLPNLRSLFRGREEQRNIVALPWDIGGPVNPGPVSENQALSLVPVFAAVRLLATQVASLPIQTFRKTGDQRTKLPMPSLFTSPSVIGTQYDWLHRCVTSLALRGNAYGLITQRDSLGFPTMIEWLHPDDVQVQDRAFSGPGSFTQPIWYWRGRTIPLEQMVHIPWFTVPYRVKGLSPMEACAAAVSTGISAQDYTANWFANGAVPPGVFKNIQKTVSQTESDEIKSRLSAAIRSRKPLVHGADWEYSPISVSANEAKFIETQRLTATQIANIYGVPASEVGGDSGQSGMTYRNENNNGLNFVKYTLRPWLELLEEKFSSLLPRPQFIKFNLDATLRADLAQRMAAYVEARNIGIMNVDEIRALEDLPPLPDGKGQDYTPLLVQVSQSRGIDAAQVKADQPPSTPAAPEPTRLRAVVGYEDALEIDAGPKDEPLRGISAAVALEARRRDPLDPAAMERKFNPEEPRRPDGKWGGGGVVKDALKLADRIQLDKNEQLIGSDFVDLGDMGTAMAVTNGPNGPHLRLGMIYGEDKGKWSGANKGGTVILDPAEVDSLHDKLAAMGAVADKRSAEIWASYDANKAKQRELNAQIHKIVNDAGSDANGMPNLNRDQLAKIKDLQKQTIAIDEHDYSGEPEVDETFAKATIPVQWGDLALSAEGRDDEHNRWGISMDVARPNAEPFGSDYPQLDAKSLPEFLRRLAAMRAAMTAAPATRAAGHDTTPGHDQLHHYWTRDPEGLAKWADSPKPWTTLRDHLLKYLPPEEATKAASKWFEEVFGFAAGSDLNRVTHGKPPRGHKVGPG